MRLARYRKLGLLMVFLGLYVGGTAGKAYAQGAVAQVDRNRIALDETLNLTVTISGDDGDVDISAIQDFRVISRGSSSSIQIVNTKVNRETVLTYSLVPLKEGRLEIPALTVKSGGKTYKTKPIEVAVSHSQPQSQVDDRRDLYLTADVSNSAPYTGQPFIFTLKLVSALQYANGQIQSITFDGFNSKQISDPRKTSRIINGRRYSIVEVPYLLVPIHAGDITIAPVVLQCEVPERHRGQSRSPFDAFFDDPFFNTRRKVVTLRSDPVPVNVRELPPYSGKIPFSGLVGTFDIRTEVDQKQLHVGDSTTLAVTVQGQGNLPDLGPPGIDIPDAFKTYDDAPEEDIEIGPDGYDGKKIFRRALVPMQAGTFKLAGANLVYFNPQVSQYQTLTSPPVQVEVLPSEKRDTFEAFKAPSSSSAPRKPAKLKVKLTGHDILPLKTELTALESASGLSWPGFVLWLAAPVLLFCGIQLTLRGLRKEIDTPAFMANRARQALKEARKTREGEAFFAALHKALVSAILSIAGIRGESLTYAEAVEILESRGIDARQAEKAASLLQRIDSARYGGTSGGDEQRQELVRETENLVKQLLH